MLEFLALILALIIGSIAVINKTNEARYKDEIRIEMNNNNFAFLSNRALMGFISGIFLLPLIIFINLSVELCIFIGFFATLRYITWSKWSYFRGKYSDAQQQATIKYTLLEGYVGPAASAIVFSLYFLVNTEFAMTIIWVLIGGYTLLIAWLFRDKSANISHNLKIVLIFQGLVVVVETIALKFIHMIDISFTAYMPEVIQNSKYINEQFICFLVIIGFSSIFSGIHFYKYLQQEYKIIGYKGIKIGVVSGLHDALYFSAFALCGPSFLIFRRFLMIPLQGGYIMFIDVKNDKDNIKKTNIEIVQIFCKQILEAIKIPPLSNKDGRVFLAGLVDQSLSIPLRLLGKLL